MVMDSCSNGYCGYQVRCPTGFWHFLSHPCFFEETGCNHTVNDTQHLARQFGVNVQQEYQLVGEAEHASAHGEVLHPPAMAYFQPCILHCNRDKILVIRLKHLLLVQLNATCLSLWQMLHCTRRNPYSSRPHLEIHLIPFAHDRV